MTSRYLGPSRCQPCPAHTGFGTADHRSKRRRRIMLPTRLHPSGLRSRSGCLMYSAACSAVRQLALRPTSCLRSRLTSALGWGSSKSSPLVAQTLLLQAPPSMMQLQCCITDSWPPHLSRPQPRSTSSCKRSSPTTVRDPSKGSAIWPSTVDAASQPQYSPRLPHPAVSAAAPALASGLSYALAHAGCLSGCTQIIRDLNNAAGARAAQRAPARASACSMRWVRRALRSNVQC